MPTMEPNNPPAAPQKKLSTVALLRAEIEQLKAEKLTLATTASELNKQVEGYREAQTKHEEELADVGASLTALTAALRPFRKLKEWEGQWPDAEICLRRPITFGDLKGAYEASLKSP